MKWQEKKAAEAKKLRAANNAFGGANNRMAAMYGRKFICQVCHLGPMEGKELYAVKDRLGLYLCIEHFGENERRPPLHKHRTTTREREYGK